ncbi:MULTISPECIES: gamma carbonic anhydrase family protein [Inquilinus]|uniref:Carbonic anhydrase/acetyltransferase-like protein (Isoleucine patch superfamily) n=1 Tax=Inquilinus ginsengisoli TaxID=363840 RepID=A0ABU1JHP3_9PROT|nr:gamma carbonic anhydrase family protein [Inquilinus ginsengisoli]MDR6288086.1 carbonic anhydrase/acetyltransferase-like protein (isoleucine patch superfamily) [Inquilinus ginsengisoli]
MSTGAIILPYRDRLPRIAADAFIAPGAVVIGDVEIGPGTSVWFGCVIRGDVSPIRIGARTNIQDGTVVHVATADGPSHIGDDVTIGHMALIHACTLADRSFVGMKACVMDRAVVESDAMVAAGALLTPGKRVPAGQLWAGSPARFVRTLTDDEHEHHRKLCEGYVSLGVEYRANVLLDAGSAL